METEKRCHKVYSDMNYTHRKCSLYQEMVEAWKRNWREPSFPVKTRFSSLRKNLKKGGWQFLSSRDSLMSQERKISTLDKYWLMSSSSTCLSVYFIPDVPHPANRGPEVPGEGGRSCWEGSRIEGPMPGLIFHSTGPDHSPLWQDI